MSGDEVFVGFISVIAAVAGLTGTTVSRLHPLHFRSNAGIGLVRAAVVLSLLWLGFVLHFFADPSVQGIYVWFYLVMGLAVVKVCGQLGAAIFGVRFRVDVCERRNPAAALFLAAFVLATGAVFGGCLWGEADPDSDWEGGWWIPVGFFAMGWITLVVMTALFLWREPGSLREQIRQNRSIEDARAAAAYIVGMAIILTQAVAGDFLGWTRELLTFGMLGVMLLVHEGALVATGSAGVEHTLSKVPRWMESGFYLLCGFVTWGLNWALSRWGFAAG